MPKFVDDCVKALMADPKFKPKDPSQTKEDAAWAVCQTRYKQLAEGSIITLETISEPISFVIAADDGGELLRFRNAILVVAEENQNRDVILEEELQNLAATLPGRAIDYDHQWQRTIGVFTEAHVVQVGGTWGLSVGGLIWADRFPEEAQSVKEGRLSLSIEADASTAECSICGGIFERTLDYCEHLFDRARYGASRILHGLRAVGGGLTPHPAGTGTDFDLSKAYFVAHHNLEGGGEVETIDIMDDMHYEAVMAKELSYRERKDLPDRAFALIQKKDGKKIRRFPIHDCSHARNALSRLPTAKNLSSRERARIKSKAEAAVKKLCKTRGDQKAKGGTKMPELEELQKQLEEMTAKYDELIVKRDEELADYEEKVNGLAAKVEELTGKLTEAEKEKTDLVAAHRKDILAMKGMEEDEIEKQAEVFGTMTNAQFELLVAHVQTEPAQTPPPGTSGGFTPGGGGGDDKPVLTL